MAKRAKAGTSKTAAATRRVTFAKAYVANGMNAERAAITAGLSPKTAASSGQRMMTNVEVKRLIADFAKKYAVITGLDLDRTLREVARVAYSDPRKFYTPVLDAAGKPVEDAQSRAMMRLMDAWEMDADTAATVASVEVDEIKAGEAGVIGHTVKIKQWDKNAALEKAMKYHGLYEKDNAQKPQMPSIEVHFVK